MRKPVPNFKTLLLGVGLAAVLVASLSVVDMLLPRAFDGIIFDSDSPQVLVVLSVVPGSGAEQAGILAGDRVAGIAHNAIRNHRHAYQLMERLQGDGRAVVYLIERDKDILTRRVRIDRRSTGQLPYFLACLLALFFFAIGLFVLQRRPDQSASRVFYLLSTLFLLFLVCRLRPASYSQVDDFVLSIGTAALLLLPASFLHFFLIFPRPVHLLPARRRALLLPLYLLPPAVLAAAYFLAEGTPARLYGAPVVNWWVLAVYMLLGLTALAWNAIALADERERRGARLVLLGACFGLLPFLGLAVAYPAVRHSERFLYLGVLPLALVPLTFAYAIVRFQLLDIRIILRRGLVYTLTTAALTIVYALGIATFNHLMGGSGLAASRFSPLLLALAIVLLFEPLRRWLQGALDRFFIADRSRLQRAMVDLGEALSAHVDPNRVVRELVAKLPQHLDLHFAALYLARDGRLERTAGPSHLPALLPDIPALNDYLSHLSNRRSGEPSRRLLPLPQLDRLAQEAPEVALLRQQLEAAGVELLADLSSPRRRLGLVLLSDRRGNLSLEPVAQELLGGLLSQTAIALETGLLLEERTHRVELDRELQIASSIQTSLIPEQVYLDERWEVAALCRPAQDVGGDFFTQLPGAVPGSSAMVYGDVAGKSVSGALLMMATHEILHTLAMTHPRPQELLQLANSRLYELHRQNAPIAVPTSAVQDTPTASRRHTGPRPFVALGYLAAEDNGRRLRYALAGQPPLLLRQSNGHVRELPLPAHRLPLGCFAEGIYPLLEVELSPGDMVLACSDGVIEARNAAGDVFGSDRLLEVLRQTPPDAHVLLRRLLDALDDFVLDHQPYDDLTLVALCRRA